MSYNYQELLEGLRKGDIRSLAKAVTLIESEKPEDRTRAEHLLQTLSNPAKKKNESLRIGITGVPGAGKSTFIDRFGLDLINANHKVAVLAVDPSSTITKGSILGDKTRMQELSVEKNAFIRPSPTRGNLGGVTRRTMETIRLCEEAGFDRIIIETVGVGQSEISVSQMVDVFISLQIPGAGDDLQGIKKGIVEISDIILITKNDGQFKLAAKTARQHLLNAFHIQTKPPPSVILISSLENTGFNDLSHQLTRLVSRKIGDDSFDKTRTMQNIIWFENELSFGCLELFKNSSNLQKAFKTIKNEIESGTMIPSIGARNLLQNLLGKDPNLSK